MWNETCNCFLTYKELYTTSKADVGGTAGDYRRMLAHVDMIAADPEEKVRFCVALVTMMGNGETPEEAWETVVEKMEPYRELLAEMERLFPDIVPTAVLTPIVEVTPV